jgi:hypothetical protein
MDEVPCKKCLVLPICKAKVKTLGRIPYGDIYFKLVLHCEMLTNYIYYLVNIHGTHYYEERPNCRAETTIFFNSKDR